MSIYRDTTPVNQRQWLEAKVENEIRLIVKDYGGIAYKFKSPQQASVPDRLIVLPKRHIFFMEVKRWGEAPTPGQFREAERILLLGYKTYFIDNVPDARHVLEGVMREWVWESPVNVSPPGKKYEEFWQHMYDLGWRLP